jgi:hypothetical protein
MPEETDPEGGTPTGAPDTTDAPKADTADEAAKWKAMARKHEAEAKKNADAAKKLAEIEDANKSEVERAAATAKAAEDRAVAAELKAMRLEVAAAKGLTPAQAKRLVGTTAEELEADADELLDTFKPAGDGEQSSKPQLPGKPQQQLRSGGDPTEEPTETDPAKLADAISRGF